MRVVELQVVRLTTKGLSAFTESPVGEANNEGSDCV